MDSAAFRANTNTAVERNAKAKHILGRALAEARGLDTDVGM